MGYLLDVLLCGGVVAAKLLFWFMIAITIQGVVYRTTKFSIYNFIMKKLSGGM